MGADVIELLDGPFSRTGEGNLKTGPSDAVGNAENGPSLLTPRLMGGRPRALPVPPSALLLHADETTFAPCRLLAGLPLDGVMADLGSSAQNAFLVEGVMADWGIG